MAARTPNDLIFAVPGNLSASATTTSNVIDVVNLESFAIQLRVDATSHFTGTFDLQMSLDEAPGRSMPNRDDYITTWTTISGSSQTARVNSGSYDTVGWDDWSTAAPWIRVRCVTTAGSGSLTGRRSGKGTR